MNKLFVYGIFLSEPTRYRYGMSNPKYAVVKGYSTVQKYGNIVEAVYVGGSAGLTGLLVDVRPAYWEHIDLLEHGYDRIEVETINGERAWMYAAKEVRNADHE